MTQQFEFKWAGIDLDGKYSVGTLSAQNKNHAIIKLSERNITILSLKKTNYFISHQHNKPFTKKDLLDFTQQLQLLLQTNIALTDALELMANAISKKVVKNMIQKIKCGIMHGLSFHETLKQFPAYFNNTFCHLIYAGEQSDQLDVVLLQLIVDQEHALELKSKINKALFYPATVLCIALLITLGLIIFVIPQFGSIYSNFGAQLPGATRTLIAISNQVIQHGAIIFFSAIAIIFLLKLFLKKIRPLRKLFHRIIITIKPFRNITLTAGIPLIDALYVTNQSISNPFIQQQMKAVSDAVLTGQSLHAALSHCPHFPVRAKSIIAIAENADALPKMLQKIAAIYRQQLNNGLERLSKLLEPVIMIGVASLVSGLIIAMYLPIFRMGSVI